MRKFRTAFWVCLAVVLFTYLAAAQQATIRSQKANEPQVASSEREQDGLNGRVRRVRVETAKILIKAGQPVEGPRVLGGITTYDINGRKIDSVAHPVESSAPSGKEQYTYDDNGNIIEMIVRASDGSILTKETYHYEFDAMGNWKKMNSSVAVYEDGKLSFEPVEVTYRTITYYYDQNIEKIAGSAPSKSGPDLASSGKVDSIKKGRTPPAAESVYSSEPKIISSDHATAAQLGSNGTEKPGKDSVVSLVTAASPVTEDDPLVKTSSSKTAVPPAPRETPAPTPEKMTVAQVSRVTAYEFAQPNNAVPSPSPTAVEEKPKVAAPTSSASTPLTKTASAAAAPDFAPAAVPAEDTARFYKQGLSHLMAGRYAEAATALRQAIAQDPNDALAYAKLGVAYSALGQHKETVATLKMAIQINPDVLDAEAYYRLGDSYTALGKRSEALQALKKAMYIVRAQAIEANPQKYNGVPQLPILHYALGLANFNAENYKEAMKEFKQATELKPDFAEAHYGVALTYIAFEDLRSAEKEEKLLRPLNARLADKVAGAVNTGSVLSPGSDGVGRRHP